MAKKRQYRKTISHLVDPKSRPSVPRIKPTVYFRGGGVQICDLNMALAFKRRDERRIAKNLEPLIDRIEGLD